jgi:hypothetical protein
MFGIGHEGLAINVMHPPLARTKSASGFGMPPEMMADPLKVGSGLAKKVGSTKPYIRSDFAKALGLFGNQHFPVAMGKFLASMAKKHRSKNESQTTHAVFYPARDLCFVRLPHLHLLH